jgi:hypothetical protein
MEHPQDVKGDQFKPGQSKAEGGSAVKDDCSVDLETGAHR